MLEKSEISFIFLWVINPIVILFYQNCATHSTSPFVTEPAQVEAPKVNSRGTRAGIPVCISKIGAACSDTDVATE